MLTEMWYYKNDIFLFFRWNYIEPWVLKIVFKICKKITY